MSLSVLLPVDDSVAAHRAIQYVVKMRERLPMSVLLLSVIPLSQLEYHGFQPAQIKQIRDRAYSLNEKIMSKQREELEKAGILVDSLVEEGNPGEVICRVAAHEAVDMVVISPNSSGKLTNLVFGSVTNKVVHECHVPVLLVR
jgi:nucleotide-binding universal stress UspA family protein